MKAWLRKGLKDWVKKQRSKDRCGVFPFQLPAWFPFTPCCVGHDLGYSTLREEAIEEALSLGINLAQNESWLRLRYGGRVLELDSMFFECMENKTDTKKIYNVWVYFSIEKIFKTFVNSMGWEIWFENTLETYQERVAA